MYFVKQSTIKGMAMHINNLPVKIVNTQLQNDSITTYI